MAHYHQIEIIATDEATTGTTDALLEAHSFTITPQDFPNGSFPKISATTIGAASILLWEKVYGVWGQVYVDGAAVALTSTNPQEAILCYGTYAMSKAAVTTGIGAYVTRIR